MAHNRLQYSKYTTSVCTGDPKFVWFALLQCAICGSDLELSLQCVWGVFVYYYHCQHIGIYLPDKCDDFMVKEINSMKFDSSVTKLEHW